jgi:serine protease AprX
MTKGSARFGQVIRITTALAAMVVTLLPALPAYSDVGNVHGSVPVAQITAEQGAFIRLNQFTFDPLVKMPDLAQGMRYSQAAAVAAQAYIVQFKGAVLPEWKQALADAGAVVGDYLPDNAFLVKLDADAMTQVQALSFVRWIGTYEPAYKLSADAFGNVARSFRVMPAAWADLAATEKALQQLSSTTRNYGAGFSVVLDDAQVAQAAQLPAVLWIEPYYLRHTYNDVAGATIMNGSTAWTNGYTGTGMTIAVADTGLDTGNTGTMHQDFLGRVTHLSSWPVVPYTNGSCTITNANANDGAADKESGHGTHVTGSVAGNGARSSGQIKGLAYGANITMQAIEQWTTFSAGCGVSNGYYLTGIPDDVRDLLTELYGWGARVQNDSWGGGSYGVYDQTASDFDDFVHNHDDLVVVVAAGNDGIDSNADGYVNENSISSPGTAKNLIVIGASENERATGGYNPGGPCSTWYGCWGSDYPTNPTRDDALSNSREHMAAFSSRGPMNDGRIKPDLVAPGTNILSVRSSQATETGWGAYSTVYYEYMGGTSMASPLSAGAATLVKQYYVDTEHVISPSAALVKATLINSAVDITGYGNTSYEAGQPIPNNHEGWGRINVGAATTKGTRRFVDERIGLNTSATRIFTYTVASNGQPFKVSLAWSDYKGTPSAGVELVNDLNLRVTAPNNNVYLGNVFSGGWSQTGGSADNRNNVENVYIQSPQAGAWTIEVIGQNVPQGSQAFGLVINGDLTLPVFTYTYLPMVSRPSFDLTTPTLNAISNADGNGDYSVSWTSVSQATGYVLEEDDNGTFTSPDVVYSGNLLTKALTGRAIGTWYYRVKATKSGGESDWSITRTAVVLPIPAAPVLNAIDNPGLSSFTVGWQAVTYGVTYTLQEAKNSAFTSSPTTRYTGTGLSWNATGKAAGTWYYRVKVANARGTSGWSNTQSTVVAPAITNGNFESGTSNWTSYYTSGHSRSLIRNSGWPGTVLPHSGTWAVWLGGWVASGGDISYIKRTLTVPASAHFFTYWHWIASADYCGYDYGGVIVKDSIVVSSYTLCTSTSTGGWVKRIVDLNSYSGQSISIQIRAEVDSSYNSNLFIDDVAWQTTTSLMEVGVPVVEFADSTMNSAPLGVTTDLANQGESEPRMFTPSLLPK